MHEVVIGLVQADREIKATAETVRVTDTDVSLSFTEIERRGPAAARAAHVRVPPPPRRSLSRTSAAIGSARIILDWEETHGRFCSGLGDRQRR